MQKFEGLPLEASDAGHCKMVYFSQFDSNDLRLTWRCISIPEQIELDNTGIPLDSEFLLTKIILLSLF